MIRRIPGLLFAALLLLLALPALAEDQDVALHRPVSSNPGLNASDDTLCVDGDSLSLYNSGRSAPVFVEVDFGADTPLKLVRLIPSMHPEGAMSVTIYGRTSLGVTYTLATWTGTAHERKAIPITITNQTPVRYLNVTVTSSASRVGWYTVQCINSNGVTGSKQDTWGQLKALYR